MHDLYAHLKDALRNLAPIIAVIGGFQLLVMRELPDGLGAILSGLVMVVVGLAFFLQGLELSIFPVAKNLSNEFARMGSLPLLIAFGFCLGFAAVVAEPALIAVAGQAADASGGHIDALTLRLLVATSVGAVIAIGVLRTLLGHTLHAYAIGGYALIAAATFFAPKEIIGLAYDSGGVTTNVITAPLIVSLGLGLAVSLRGRNPLMHGFGLLALVVMMPMLVLQLYGIHVFSGEASVAPAAAEVAVAAAASTEATPLSVARDIARMFLDLLPIVAVIVGFQYLVIRRHLAHLRRIGVGFVALVLGLYVFVVGLQLALFPLGERMAVQLAALDSPVYVCLFAFALGLSATFAEPALQALGEQAQEAGGGRLRAGHVRVIAALGVATGITLGSYRIVAGGDYQMYFLALIVVLILVTLAAPKYVVALSYDVGAAGSTAVNVPLVTALGMGLASQIEGRSTLIDGFGLVAFGTVFPIVMVMLYACIAEWGSRRQQGADS